MGCSGGVAEEALWLLPLHRLLRSLSVMWIPNHTQPQILVVVAATQRLVYSGPPAYAQRSPLRRSRPCPPLPAHTSTRVSVAIARALAAAADDIWSQLWRDNFVVKTVSGVNSSAR